MAHGFIRRHYPVAIAFIFGAFVALVASLVWAQRYAVKAKTTYELALEPTELATTLYQGLGVELRPGHTVEVIANGDVIERVATEVKKAKRSIDIVMYIWEPGVASTMVSTALAARARGVACRIVVDAFGSPTFDRILRPELTAAGCEVHVFRPLPGIDPIARNHRKILIFDGQVAIIGGLGVRDDWLGDGVHGYGWRDTGALFTGPAVREAQQAFAENWQEAGGAALPAIDLAPSPATGTVTAAWIASTSSTVVTRAERLTQIVITQAKHRLWITNAYFAPSPAIVDLLQRKAEAGVDVRLLVPGDKSDVPAALRTGRELYPRLRNSGVKIWEYLPVMIHAKTMLADADLTVIGSINLDPLSLNKLDENALLIKDPATAARLEAMFTADTALAKPIIQH